MPLLLPPLSRRRLLVASAALAGATVPGCRAETRRHLERAAAPTPTRLLLLSDPHAAADAAATSRGGAVIAERVAATVAAAAAEHDRRPFELAVVDGDCALDTGEPGDYERLASLLAPLRERGLPVWLTLGNHDHRDRMEAAFADPRPQTGPAGRRVARVETDNAVLLLLDSLIETDRTPGELGPAQLAWLEAELAATPAGRPALVFLHHPPLPPEPGVEPWGLLDDAELAEVLRHRPAATALVHGHTHAWSRRLFAGVPLIGLPSMAYPFDAIEAVGFVAAEAGAGGVAFTLHAPGHAADGASERIG
ncbi:metallophosphoesterase family protein [Phycisphaera mikurensis]|uniref:Putative hydrolase n=1 Tax=Phycisphaera mikurensis (strain NBRC 102666 / KCTC 22515 / FYK2301M01) TaxID=1142394 RepID=I0IGW4_PHYMF|nr:metallophosphoesterase [Phycisphaera mikurensis]MBB6440759.1 hypothetical protein [Phycisphaera mikurensis]BAM04502.1 putative hydrolase [Phycisphaera mikurensis NBRC 102666]